MISKLIQIFSALALVVNVAMSQEQSISIEGKVLESGGQPIEFATVYVADLVTDEPITGTTTDLEGTFVLETEATNFYIEISFLGFASERIDEFNVIDGKISLGEVVLSEDKQVLDEVVVVGEKSTTEFKLDKRVFNVGKDLSTTGASALEVLDNVPSVNVSIEGQVSLRGSAGVQMLINGKPSVLASEQGNALGTLTADMIEKVEVITNPSAKYDAEGTSGIINIVLKKEEKEGINGSVTLNTGVPNNHSLGLSMNRRTEKLNLFSQFGIGRRTFPSNNETYNLDKTTNESVSSEGQSFKNESFINVILGTDYHINDLNVITLSGHFAFEKEDEDSDTDFSIYDGDNQLTDAYNRTELTTATNPKWQYELQYKKSFLDDEDHMLLVSALGNFFGKDQQSEFYNATTFGNESDTQQETMTDFKEAEYTFKLDYTKPFREKYTIETGAQYVINDVTNDYAVNDFADGEWTNNPLLTNIFDYYQNVLGVYGTAAYEGDKWGIKAGLRLENTDLFTRLETTGEENSQNYTNLFPSAHTSYKFSDHFSLQAGYSRRIFRPRLWDLNPFTNIRNNYSISTGNPDLQPEFTDSYELTSIHTLEDLSMSFAVYYRFTDDVVDEITYFENNVSVSRPENVGVNHTTGFEFNGKYTPSKWLTLNGDLNLNFFRREGTFEETVFDFNGDRWSTRVTAKFKLPADFDVEVSGDYRSSYETVQQEISGYAFADLGVRKKIIGGKFILNLSIRDVFGTSIRESITDQPDFYLRDYRRRGRFVIFGISYGFGKGEAMEFSGQKHF